MLRLSSYDKTLSVQHVARQSYMTDGLKHVNWNGFIEVRDQGKVFTTYFRSHYKKRPDTVAIFSTSELSLWIEKD